MMRDNDFYAALYEDYFVNCLDETMTIVMNAPRNNGYIKIKNKSKVFSDEQLSQILNLLHEDYHDLGVNLTIHGKWCQTLLKTLNPFTNIDLKTLRQAFQGKCGGVHNNGRIDIFPYVYNLKRFTYGKEGTKLLVLFAIIHEIRHAYQRKHKAKKYDRNKENYIDCEEQGYQSQWVERDANHFAQRFMLKNKKIINECLGIKVDWDCRWGNFNILG